MNRLLLVAVALAAFGIVCANARDSAAARATAHTAFPVAHTLPAGAR
ncbi:hypothetical protein [Ancylobacter lacus]|nr:hypothetical protein [Ancylobacter lacus]MBS7538662.1 hypothetical protein [Ancylobacter lacus]